MSLIHTPPRGYPTVLAGAISRRSVEYQTRTNELLRLYGKSADSPHPGETDAAYAVRLLQSAASYAGEPWGLVDFTQQPATAIPGFFRNVVDEAVARFKAPVGDNGEGDLRQSTERDRTGRERVTFFGDPELCWGRFKQPPRIIERFINLPRGADSTEARARRAAAEARRRAAEAALAREEAAQAAAAPERPAGFLQRLRPAVTDAT